MLAILAQVLRIASSERGQTLAEYGVILALVALGVVVPTVFVFRTAIGDVYATVTACLQDLPVPCTPS